MASKILTRDQAQARKDAAVRFVENVLNDPDKAADIESEDLDDWIERKRITLVENPARRADKASGPSKQDLQDQIDELTQENQDLQDQLDAIVDIVVPPDEDDDTDDDDDLD